MQVTHDWKESVEEEQLESTRQALAGGAPTVLL